MPLNDSIDIDGGHARLVRRTGRLAIVGGSATSSGTLFQVHSASPDHGLAPPVPPLQALRTRVAITSDNSTGITAYVLSQWGKLHGTRSGLHAQHSVTFCGELEGMAPHLTCGQTVSRMRYPSSPDEVWTG